MILTVCATEVGLDKRTFPVMKSLNVENFLVEVFSAKPVFRISLRNTY